MTRSHIFAILFGLAVTAMGAPSTALACKCMEQSIEQAREEAASVFEGRVKAIEEVAGSGEAPPTKRVTLALVRTWKGLENRESVQVSTSASSASCGYAFEPNTSYLVYLGGSEDAPVVSACSRTRPMADAGEDLAALGVGITPVEISPSTAPASQPSTSDKAAPKAGGCGTMSGAARASAAWLLLPVTGLSLGARRRRSTRS